MSMLDPQNTVKPRISGLMRGMLTAMKQRYTLVYNAVWHDRDGLSPQEVFDQIGPDSVEMMTSAYDAYAFIQRYDPDFSLPALQAISPNSDGTVTLAAPDVNPAPVA